MHVLPIQISRWLTVPALAVLLSACSSPAPVDDGAESSEPASPSVSDAAPVRRQPAQRDALSASRQDFAPPPGENLQPILPAFSPLVEFHPTPGQAGRERYGAFDDNPVRRVREHPVSTFSIDVDTGSYSNVRRMLRSGHLPPPDAVRVEEMINYFSYDYPVPRSPATPFQVHVEQMVTPWNDKTRLLQIGLQGYRPEAEEIPAANLVFLVDVSGSMASNDKLPLLIHALKMLVRELDREDRIAVVAYAGSAGVVLESTPGDRQAEIRAALERLAAGGGTHGAAGIELAYAQATRGFIEDGINRVILATDGDFNVGITDFDALKQLAERKRDSGIALTTLGFGTGNLNDHLMEQLADAGNGNYAYIDTLAEARKVLVDELSATLMTIAADVKIQVEFNPAVVAEYRLIGYENRTLRREDFSNDEVDAGEIGAGHSVTALYEIALVGSGGERVEALRYGRETSTSAQDVAANELGFLRLRYKQPGEDESRLIEHTIARRIDGPPSEHLSFAAAVAGFGQHLRGGVYLEGFGLDQVHQLASVSRGSDPFGYRGELLQLIRLADGFQLASR